MKFVFQVLPLILLLLIPATPCRAAGKPVFLGSQGQYGPEVRYVGFAGAVNARFGPTKVEYQVAGAPLGVEFLNADPGRLLTATAAPGKVNLASGGDPSQWVRGAQAYRDVVYRNLYRDIDLVYLERGGRIKSEYRVRPGADPGVIRWRYEGAARPSLDASGNLLLPVSGMVIRDRAPEAYQTIAGEQVRIAARYRVEADGAVGFELGAYNRTLPLIIDPEISSSTYLGGWGVDCTAAVAVDSSGYIYVAGWTDSPNLPTVNAVRPASGGGVDAFVAKLSPDGRTLVYLTYLGGTGDDRAYGIGVDGSGSAYVTGWTGSYNFPLRNAMQPLLGGGRDAFVTKLNASGAIVYSTFYGGSANDSGNSIAVDASGTVWVAGDTASSNLMLRKAYQAVKKAGTDAFVLKLDPAGALALATYLGGDRDDIARGIAADAAGNMYVAGGTWSMNFPLVNAVRTTTDGTQEAFAAKLSADGASLVYSTYLGGSGGVLGAPELAYSVAVDAAGSAYVAGITSSVNFPAINAYQPALRGASDAFVTKLAPSGASLVYSTFLGGSSLEYATAIKVDASGAAYVAGYTSSSDFPVVDATQTARGGYYDAFVSTLAADGRSLSYSTYLGGNSDDTSFGLALLNGSMYVSGQTGSLNFPVAGAPQPVEAGSLDGFFTLLKTAGPEGALQSAACTGINGWAWDPARPNEAVNVEIYDGATLLATVPANVYRADLAGLGNGNHAFSYVLKPRQRDSKVHNIRVRIAGTASDLPGSPRSLACVEGDVDGNGHPDILWQEDITRKVDLWFMGGAQGDAHLSTVWINDLGVVGWYVLGFADLDNSGKPDILWQNQYTSQTCVWYMGGVNGNVGIASSWINDLGLAGWTIAATADLDGNGTPDLIWISELERKVCIWYMAGKLGNVAVYSDWISSTGVPGWRVVASVDLNGDTIPDILWQNDATRQVRVWYMTGSLGNTLLSMADIAGSANMAGQSVIGARDVDGDGHPDLIWQAADTRAVTVWYLGGATGTTVLRTGTLSTGRAGWFAVMR